MFSHYFQWNQVSGALRWAVNVVLLYYLQVSQNNQPICEHLLCLSVLDIKRMTRAGNNIIMGHHGVIGGGLEAWFYLAGMVVYLLCLLPGGHSWPAGSVHGWTRGTHKSCPPRMSSLRKRDSLRPRPCAECDFCHRACFSILVFLFTDLRMYMRSTQCAFPSPLRARACASLAA